MFGIREFARHSIFAWNPQIPKHIKTMPVNVKKSPICVVKGLIVLAVPSKKTSQGRLAGNLLSKVVVPHGQLPSQAHRKGIVPIQTLLKNGTDLTFVFWLKRGNQCNLGQSTFSRKWYGMIWPELHGLIHIHPAYITGWWLTYPSGKF
jgi:hypothetical protein